MFVGRFKKTSMVVATLLWGCILTGCDRGDTVQAEPEKVDPSSPESYMNDPAFMAKVKEREARGNALRARHMKVRAEVDALKANDPASPKLPELEKELASLQAAFQANRKETLAVVRERITPKAAKPKSVETK